MGPRTIEGDDRGFTLTVAAALLMGVPEAAVTTTS